MVVLFDAVLLYRVYVISNLTSSQLPCLGEGEFEKMKKTMQSVCG